MSNRSRADKNREKVVQDRLQLLLTRMLQDEDNKYCIDCDSKGPRWASWNIGIFLCIRCAGMHRNLGVHISKVKSVNLDSWTPQQVASMQVMGNSKGRAVYEAGVPEDFRRPQGDSALESFIRSKYEKKKYIAREWTPTKPPDLPLGWAEIIEAEKQKKDLRSIVLPSRANPKIGEPAAKPALPKPSPVINKTSVPAKKENVETSPISNGANPSTSSSSAVDLLGLSLQTPTVNGEDPVKATTSNLDLLSLGTSGDDVFNSFVSATTATTTAQTTTSTSSNVDFEAAFSTPATNTTSSQMSKDSIMALFNKPPPAPAAVPVQPVGGSNANALAGLNFGTAPQGFSQQPGFNQLQQQPQGQGSLGMTPQSQLNQFGGMQGMGAPPQTNMANNPFLSNTVDLGFGALNSLSTAATTNGNAKNSSWGFGQ